MNNSTVPAACFFAHPSPSLFGLCECRKAKEKAVSGGKVADFVCDAVDQISEGRRDEFAEGNQVDFVVAVDGVAICVEHDRRIQRLLLGSERDRTKQEVCIGCLCDGGR